MAVALLNGKSFTHKGIVFNWGGVPITSLSNLDVNWSAMKGFNWGTGALPDSIGEGRYEQVELSFEISMTDFKALTQAVVSKNLLDLDLTDIPVTLLNGANTWGFTIKNVAVTENSFSTDVDTLDIKVPITAIASHLEWK